MPSQPPRTDKEIRLQRALNEAPFWMFGALAILLLVMAWPPQLAGWIAVGVMLSIAAAGIRYRRRHPVFFAPTPVDPTAGLPPLEKAAWLRRFIWPLLGITALISLMTWWSLYRREHDAGGPTPVVAVLAFVYAFFGLWPAVLLPISGGVILSLLLLRKARQLERSN